MPLAYRTTAWPLRRIMYLLMLVSPISSSGWDLHAVGVFNPDILWRLRKPDNNNAIAGVRYQRPNATGVDPGSSGAFGLSPQFSFGNTSRFLGFRGPGTRNLDISVFRMFW